jgi:hypothetical protein
MIERYLELFDQQNREIRPLVSERRDHGTSEERKREIESQLLLLTPRFEEARQAIRIEVENAANREHAGQFIVTFHTQHPYLRLPRIKNLFIYSSIVPADRRSGEKGGPYIRVAPPQADRE